MMNLMKMRMRKLNFSFFLALTLTSFFSFCWSVLLSLGLMNFFFFSLTCVVYLAYLLRKSLGFLIPSLPAYHMSYLQLYHFFPASSLESTTGEITFALCRSVCRDSASFKLCDTVYCIEYIFLDNISSSLSVVRARTFRFASKIERVLRIGWLSESNLENSLNRRRFYDIKW